MWFIRKTITIKVTNTTTLQCNVGNYICDQTRTHTIAESSIVHIETSARLSNIADGRKSLRPEVKRVYLGRLYY